MNSQRIIGLVLFAVGVILLVIGLQSSNSVVDQVSNTFLGRFTQATTWYIVGGIGLGLFGLLVSFLGMGDRAAK